jgi:hypothetical protein
MHGAGPEGEASSHEAPASGRLAKEEMQGKTRRKIRTGRAFALAVARDAGSEGLSE